MIVSKSSRKEKCTPFISSSYSFKTPHVSVLSNFPKPKFFLLSL